MFFKHKYVFVFLIIVWHWWCVIISYILYTTKKRTSVILNSNFQTDNHTSALMASVEQILLICNSIH